MIYNVLLSACGKGKQPAQALEVFLGMQRQGMVPNVITYNPLISACEATATVRPHVHRPRGPGEA